MTHKINTVEEICNHIAPRSLDNFKDNKTSVELVKAYHLRKSTVVLLGPRGVGKRTLASLIDPNRVIIVDEESTYENIRIQMEELGGPHLIVYDSSLGNNTLLEKLYNGFSINVVRFTPLSYPVLKSIGWDAAMCIINEVDKRAQNWYNVSLLTDSIYSSGGSARRTVSLIYEKMVTRIENWPLQVFIESGSQKNSKDIKSKITVRKADALQRPEILPNVYRTSMVAAVLLDQNIHDVHAMALLQVDGMNVGRVRDFLFDQHLKTVTPPPSIEKMVHTSELFSLADLYEKQMDDDDDYGPESIAYKISRSMFNSLLVGAVSASEMKPNQRRRIDCGVKPIVVSDRRKYDEVYEHIKMRGVHIYKQAEITRTHYKRKNVDEEIHNAEKKLDDIYEQYVDPIIKKKCLMDGFKWEMENFELIESYYAFDKNLFVPVKSDFAAQSVVTMMLKNEWIGPIFCGDGNLRKNVPIRDTLLMQLHDKIVGHFTDFTIKPSWDCVLMYARQHVVAVKNRTPNLTIPAKKPAVRMANYVTITMQGIYVDVLYLDHGIKRDPKRQLLNTVELPTEDILIEGLIDGLKDQGYKLIDPDRWIDCVYNSYRGIVDRETLRDYYNQHVLYAFLRQINTVTYKSFLEHKNSPSQ